MLTVDQVRARRRGTELVLSKLDGRTRARALELARELLAVAEAHVGEPRERFEEACRAIPVAGRERKLADGLRKLVEDRAEFDVHAEVDPRQLRAEVFEAATRARRALQAGETFDRDAFVREQAGARGLSVAELERALYADLKGAQLLLRVESIRPEALVQRYALSQKQAVLLRAVDVVADVHCRDAYTYRALFRQLKFRRLMYRVQPRADGGYRIHLDGPFSLFSASTKYGLALALALPSLLACDRYRIQAALRWGKERQPLTFTLEGGGEDHAQEDARLPDEVQTFLERFHKLDTPWQAEAARDLLDVPGAGLCVPDLRFIHGETGEVAYLEVMGYWSRDAVWKRVELAQAGLDARVIFAVSQRLRVSQEVLGDDVPSELYVYKGALSPKQILRRLERED